VPEARARSGGAEVFVADPPFRDSDLEKSACADVAGFCNGAPLEEAAGTALSCGQRPVIPSRGLIAAA
jgi:hypothetical protein